MPRESTAPPAIILHPGRGRRMAASVGLGTGEGAGAGAGSLPSLQSLALRALSSLGREAVAVLEAADVELPPALRLGRTLALAVSVPDTSASCSHTRHCSWEHTAPTYSHQLALS